MGYFIKEHSFQGQNHTSDFSSVPSKTHTPVSTLKDRGLRFYNSETGRWMSRDPIGEQQSCLLVFVGNAPIYRIDPRGLWGYDVHYGWTRAWGVNLGVRTEGAIAIATADEDVDHGNLSFMPFFGDQSYHFNRNLSGNDSRLDHYNHHLAVAKSYCLGVLSDDGDRAAIEMGMALHPLQDWVAHGDYG